MIREIITKAVIGKGHLRQTNQYELHPECKVDEVLGCWIIGHHYEALMKNEKLFVKGAYDINLWYALEDKQESKVYVNTVEYLEELPISTKEDVDFNGDMMLVCTCPMQPVCLEANKHEDYVKVTIEKTMHVDIVGETKISVEVSEASEVWDEIDQSINPSFLEK